MKKVFLLMLMTAATAWLYAQGQEGVYLQDMVKVVEQLRKGSTSVRNSAVATLSAEGKPKITLMDELTLVGTAAEKANEVKGTKGNRFKLNQVVAHVYKSQNQQMESKGEMLNGNETGIHFSAVEKSVRRGGQVTYQLRGRTGSQEFMFLSYAPKTTFRVTVYIDNRKAFDQEATGSCAASLNNLSRRNVVYMTITYPDDKANKEQVESFAILNYNPQK